MVTGITGSLFLGLLMSVAPPSLGALRTQDVKVDGNRIKVTVENQMQSRVYVQVHTDQNHVTETKYFTKKDKTFEELLKFMMDGSIECPVEGVEIKGKASVSTEIQQKIREYYEKNEEAKYQWTDFTQAGILQIGAGKRNEFALQLPSTWKEGDKPTYYVTISVHNEGTATLRNLAVNVQQCAAHLLVDKDGDLGIGTPPPVEGNKPAPVGSGAAVWIRLSGVKPASYIGNPTQDRLLNETSGTMNSSAATHGLELLTGAAGTALKNQDVVRIVCKTNPADPTATCAYSKVGIGNFAWVKYAKADKNDSTQSWIIQKQTGVKTNSPGETICFGDTVRFQNVKYSHAFLGRAAGLGTSTEYLTCKNTDGTTWVLLSP